MWPENHASLLTLGDKVVQIKGDGGLIAGTTTTPNEETDSLKSQLFDRRESSFTADRNFFFS